MSDRRRAASAERPIPAGSFISGYPATGRMVSRENAVIGTCILVALLVGSAVAAYTSLPDWVAMAVFLILGVVVPVTINGYAG